MCSGRFFDFEESTFYVKELEFDKNVSGISDPELMKGSLQLGWVPPWMLDR